MTVDRDLALASTVAEDEPALARGDAPISLDMKTSVLPRPHSVEAPVGTSRFEPLRVIGRGGLGEVTLARDHDIGRPVAIKRLRSGPGTCPLNC